MKATTSGKAALALAAVVLVAGQVRADYVEDFTGYASDTAVADGDSFAGGTLLWRETNNAAVAEVIAADDALRFTLQWGAGQNVGSLMQETATAGSAGETESRRATFSFQTVDGTMTAEGAFSVGLFDSAANLPIVSDWATTIAATVQFGTDSEGNLVYRIRRRNTSGDIEAWNGSAWISNGFHVLGNYSLDSQYTVVSELSDTTLTLTVLDAATDTELASASTALADLFSYGSTRWIVGDINNQNAAKTYEFTINELAMSVPEPATLGLLSMGLLLAGRARF